MKIYPLFIPHQVCPFQCVFCNQVEITNTQRPHFQDFDEDLTAFCRKHRDKKKEIAFFGGTLLESVTWPKVVPAVIRPRQKVMVLIYLIPNYLVEIFIILGLWQQANI